MKTKLMFAGATIAALGAIAFSVKTGNAFDHQDTPQVAFDRAADITDVYSFMRPNGESASNHLVLVMNTMPGATATDRFEPKLDYFFRVRTVATAKEPVTVPAPEYVVRCTFSDDTVASQKYICSVNGQQRTGSVGLQADAGADSSPIRIFAGLRADPAFADLAAIQGTLQTGVSQLKADGGVNTFAGKNVLSLVVELDVSVLVSEGKPIFAVTGETQRVGL
ncbi:MAG: DUF4331 family protein [Polyangiaceae bacterium]|nr:DUF4331 family protein [Polyangiaceae bacterium]